MLVSHKFFFSLFCQHLPCVFSVACMDKQWHNLSDADADILSDAIVQSEEYAAKLAVFRSGLIPPEDRWLQISAHDIYDKLSERELAVFELRTLQHTFPVIADALEISVSSAKTYWRRCLTKCNKAFMSTNDGNNDGC